MTSMVPPLCDVYLEIFVADWIIELAKSPIQNIDSFFLVQQ